MRGSVPLLAIGTFLLTAPFVMALASINVNRRNFLTGMMTSSVVVSLIPVSASAEGGEEEESRDEVLQRMKERRQLMQASRTSNDRQSYLDLSRQRAKLYNTTSRAVSCPPNIPCI